MRELRIDVLSNQDASGQVAPALQRLSLSPELEELLVRELELGVNVSPGTHQFTTLLVNYVL